MKREETYFTPKLEFEGNKLQMTGRLWMENPAKYFEKIIVTTQNCMDKVLFLEMNVEHINSSSIKQVLSYFNLLKDMKDSGKFERIEVVWNIQQDDEEMRSIIRDLETISELKIKIGSLDLKLN